MNNRAIRQNFNNRTYLVQEEPRGPSQLIEIPVITNGLGDIAFPDVPELRNQTDQKIIIKAIRCIPDSILTNAPISGNVVAPLAELQKISLVIYSEGWLKGKNIPICTLIDTFTEASGIPWRDRTTQLANWENVDWNKCKLEYSNGTVTAGVPYTVILEVEYLKLDISGHEIIGPA